MIKLFGLLVVGILSASLAVIFQDDIAALLGRAPVTAEVQVGSWYAYPNFADEENLFPEHSQRAIERYADREDLHFARIKIRNRTGASIPSSYIILESDYDASYVIFEAVLIRQQGDQTIRTSVSSAEPRISIGELPGASEIVVYLWTNRTLGYPYSVRDVRIVTSRGMVPTSIYRLSGDGNSFLFGIHNETVAWAFVFLMVVIAIVLLIILSHWHEYIRYLMKSEDYYLKQKISHDEDPKKFSVPAELPKDK